MGKQPSAWRVPNIINIAFFAWRILTNLVSDQILSFIRITIWIQTPFSFLRLLGMVLLQLVSISRSGKIRKTLRKIKRSKRIARFRMW